MNASDEQQDRDWLREKHEHAAHVEHAITSMRMGWTPAHPSEETQQTKKRPQAPNVPRGASGAPTQEIDPLRELISREFPETYVSPFKGEENS